MTFSLHRSSESVTFALYSPSPFHIHSLVLLLLSHHGLLDKVVLAYKWPLLATESYALQECIPLQELRMAAF
jgi:hypothetical protein